MVQNSENPKVVFSLFETVKLSVLISPRNLYISLNSIKEIEDIYFFEVNNKYISSNVLKYQHIHECVARVKLMILSIHEMKYFWLLPIKSKFSFYFIHFRTITESRPLQ